MTALTIPELAAICLGPNKSPWPLKDLLGLYKAKTLSLRSLVAKVSEAKAIYYVEARDLELLKGVSTVAELKGKWAAAVPSRATLIALNKTLNSSGATIVYISFDWRTVGIYGSFASIVNVSGKSVADPLLAEVAGVDTGFLRNAGNGLLVIGAGTAASGLIPEPFSPALVGVGAGLFATGALIKLGLALFAPDDPATPPGSDPGTPTQSGQPPAGVDPGDPPTAPVDPASLPDSPPAADANTPVATTGGGGGGGGTSEPNDPDDPGETQPGVPGDPGAPAGSPTNPSCDGPPDGLG
jgi:hypothetical protein